MARPRTAIPAAVSIEAGRIRAHRELAELNQLHFIQRSLGGGLSQDSVAALLGISQATVSRAATRPRLSKVRHVIARAAAEEISRDEMVRELKALGILYVSPARKPDSDWAVLSRALHDHAISRDEARQVAEATARRFVLRVSDSMDLEAQVVTDEAIAKMIGATTERMVASLG